MGQPRRLPSPSLGATRTPFPNLPLPYPLHHPKPSCLKTKTPGRCGGKSCLFPNPYLGVKGTEQKTAESGGRALPNRLPAGRLGAVLARAFSPSWPLSWPAGWYFAVVSVPRSCVRPDDVIPLPQARCGEHGRSPGLQSLAGEEGPSPLGTALVGPHPELILGSQAEIGPLFSCSCHQHEEQIPSCEPQLPPLLLLQPSACPSPGPDAWPKGPRGAQRAASTSPTWPSPSQPPYLLPR